MPTTVQLAAMYASVQEGLMLKQKQLKTYYGKATLSRFENKGTLPIGELWKAKQLKEYRRANGLCYKCGEKFIPGHTCNQAAVPGGQLKAADLVDPHEIISDAVLDALVIDNSEECATISTTALSGAAHPKIIHLRALVGNQVVLIVVDLGAHTLLWIKPC